MSKSSKGKKSSNSYMRYAGMSTQMIVLMFVAAWIGGKIDAYLGFELRYITLLLVFATLVAFFIKLYYDLLRND